MKKLSLNEKFISRIWENAGYYENLKTTNNEQVEVISYGNKNKGSGADYLGAKIKINGISYTGDIEIHRTEKDWELHKHKNDGKYNKVILQVVLWKSDGANFKAESKSKQRNIPTVVLSEFLTKSIHLIWREIIENPSPEFRIPCYEKNKIVSAEEKKIFLSKLSIKRLKFKASRIEQTYFITSDSYRKKVNWEKALFTYIAEALGFSKNKEQFLKLAGKINFEKVKSEGPDRTQIDSLLFGTAGFLKELKNPDEYSIRLSDNWNKIQREMNSGVMDKSEWNFFPLRPPNFPTVRLGYLCGLLCEILYLEFFKRMVYCFENSKELKNALISLFMEISVSDYWESHYDFSKKKKTEYNIIGTSRASDIITNVILPIMLLYARKFNKQDIITRITDYYLTERETSLNEITKAMKNQLSINLSTLDLHQGAIHLHNFYCIKGKCDDCYIGTRVFTEPHVSDYLRIILY
jgi:hypothetical protein